MSTYVVRLGLRAPIENEALVRKQLRAAHDYRNDLVAIERGRRHALREVDRTADVEEAEAIVRASTKSTRKAAVTRLRAARKAARDAAVAELEAIKGREDEIRRSARANTTAYWGTYLGIEAAHLQSRAQPLYGDDAVSPNDPAFVRAPRWKDCLPSGDSRADWWLHRGQLGVQLQKGLSTRDALAGTDSRVRLIMQDGLGRRDQARAPAGERADGHQGRRRRGLLYLRVGSDGRDPIWAVFPFVSGAAIPDTAIWKWVRVSVRREADWERWTCEITVDDPQRDVLRKLSRPKDGDVAAVEWSWTPRDDGSIHVATVADAGGVHEVVLPPEIPRGIRHASSLIALRTLMRNEMAKRFAHAVKTRAPVGDRDMAGSVPRYLVEAANVAHLWRSAMSPLQILMRMRLDGVEGEARRILETWYEGDEGRGHRCKRRPCSAWHGDRHLARYEDGERGQSLRRRLDWYRVLAARWRAQYSTIILSDQDLSREAQWGDDSDVRHVAGVSEFRLALRNKFGSDAIDARWRRAKDVEEAAEQSWCERARGAWMAGGSRDDGMFAAERTKTGNAWASRKERKLTTNDKHGTSRKPVASAAE